MDDLAKLKEKYQLSPEERLFLMDKDHVARLFKWFADFSKFKPYVSPEDKVLAERINSQGTPTSIPTPLILTLEDIRLIESWRTYAQDFLLIDDEIEEMFTSAKQETP